MQAVALTSVTISVEAAQLVRPREANYPDILPGQKVSTGTYRLHFLRSPITMH